MYNSDIITIYEPNDSLSLTAFVDKYSKAYSINENEISNICYKQTNVEIEDQILRRNNSCYKNFASKMAWKCGKIKMSKEANDINNIEYTDKWKDCEKENPIYSKSEHIKLEELYKNLSESEFLKNYENNSPNLLLKEIMDKKEKRIGQVYSIAILFFFSYGYYPIYDRFAHVALNNIFSKERCFPKAGDYKKIDCGKAIDYYQDYIKYYNILKKMMGKSKENNIEYRYLDRALWVYGHGFI